MDIIRVRRLDAGYTGVPVLHGLDFAIAKGRITVIVGESGSGKSTLLKTLIGLIPPLAGEIDLAGDAVDFRSERSLDSLYRRIGVLYQNSALLNSLSLYDNVALPIRMHHRDWSRAKEAEVVRTMLDRVGLHDSQEKMPYELSGGMRKRAALARAMVLEPDLIFCDEPSAGLDPVVAAELDATLLKFRDVLGLTIVIVSHELDSVRALADRAIMFGSGHALATGTIPELEQSRNEDVYHYFHARSA